MSTMLVRDQPQQGQLYQRLNALIALTHSGLGPQNVASSMYAPMVGQAFQKPLSGSTTGAATVPGHIYR
jgi:hypothetical protein